MSADSAALTVYSAPWCGYCVRLKARLDEAGIGYREVDVDNQPEALDVIAAMNGGSWLIPTVVLTDGRGLVNPSLRQVQDALAELDG